MILDHIGFTVRDFPKARAMYSAVLLPLGITASMEGEGYTGFGRDGKISFWIGAPREGHEIIAADVHVCFSARSRADVDAFYKAGLAAGFSDNGAPGIRPHYSPGYYAAFLLDTEGNNIEAVCHGE